MKGLKNVHWDRVKQQLEQIWDAKFSYMRVRRPEWEQHAGGGGEPFKLSRIIEGKRHFYLQRQGETVHTLAVPQDLLTAQEIRLVELLLQESRSQDRRPGQHLTEYERKVADLRNWIISHLEQGTTDAELPESFMANFPLSEGKIPLLVHGEYSGQRKSAYYDLKKLADSFFAEETVLIPLLDNEWLALAPESLLQAGKDEEDDPVEETLAAIGGAFHEMLATEWIGDCRISVDYPIDPRRSLLSAIIRLRESIALGKAYHVEENLCMPWMLHLEKLLDSIPAERRLEFLTRVLKRADLFEDPETLMTLEQFIALDCNVSETAKKLFIHRNTLLYRLDKFRQETGLDVRTFRHAALVHIALLLYKVTKRA